MWFLNLIRWKNLLILLLMQGLVYFFICSEPSLFDSYRFEPGSFSVLFMLWVSTLSIAAAGNIINDVYDKKTDSINKPGSNSIDVHISSRNAIFLVIGLDAVGIIIGYLFEPLFGIVNAIVAVLLWLYSYKLKCTPILGNLIVAICMGLSVAVVQFATEVCSPVLFMLYILFAGLTGLVREMVKDLEDTEGDSAAGCKTLPVTAGGSFAKSLTAATLFFGTLVVAAGCYYLVQEKPVWHLIYFGAAVILPMLVLFVMITIAKQKRDYSRISAGLKIIMVMGLLYLPLAYYLS